jgi:hypothetical protein
MHYSVRIVLGRSNHTNGILFQDPVTQCINVLADYKLDPTFSISVHFLTIIYNGQISPLVLQGGQNSSKETFPPGANVQVEMKGDYYNGTVKSMPIGPKLPNYQI